MYTTEKIKILIVEIKLDTYFFRLNDPEDFDNLLVDMIDNPLNYFYNYLLKKFKDKILDGIYTKNDIKFCRVTITYDEIEKVDLDNILNYEL